MITLDEFRRQRIALTGSPIKAKSVLLIQLANYFSETYPSDIDDAFVLETEGFLHDLLLDARNNPILRQNINTARSYASYMSSFIKSHTPRSPEYYSMPDLVGSSLYLLVASLD